MPSQKECWSGRRADPTTPNLPPVTNLARCFEVRLARLMQVEVLLLHLEAGDLAGDLDGVLETQDGARRVIPYAGMGLIYIYNSSCPATQAETWEERVSLMCVIDVCH